MNRSMLEADKGGRLRIHWYDSRRRCRTFRGALARLSHPAAPHAHASVGCGSRLHVRQLAFVGRVSAGARLSGETVPRALDDDYYSMRGIGADRRGSSALTMFARKRPRFRPYRERSFLSFGGAASNHPSSPVQPSPGLLARVQQSSAVFAAHPARSLQCRSRRSTHSLLPEQRSFRRFRPFKYLAHVY